MKRKTQLSLHMSSKPVHMHGNEFTLEKHGQRSVVKSENALVLRMNDKNMFLTSGVYFQDIARVI